jgi:membrane-associated protease RseP (regulator of RpoE activity)
VDVPIALKEKRTIAPPASVSTQLEWTVEGKTHHVVSINGEKPKDIIDAYAILLRAKADQEIVLTTGGDKGAKVRTKAVPLPDAIVQARKRFGLGIEQLTPMLAQKYGLESDDGLFVSEVLKNSIASKAGLQPGDVIVQFGRYRISTLDDFSAVMQHLPEHGRFRVGAVRGDRLGFGMMDL